MATLAKEKHKGLATDRVARQLAIAAATIDRLENAVWCGRLDEAVEHARVLRKIGGLVFEYAGEVFSEARQRAADARDAAEAIARGEF